MDIPLIGVTGDLSDGVLTPAQQADLDNRQDRSAGRFCAHWRGPHATEAHPMAALPTGFGKGRIVHKLLADSSSQQVLVIVGGLNILLQQTHSVLTDLSSHNTGESNFSLLPNVDAQTVLGTWQGLASCMRSSQRLPEFGLIVVDEVHEAGTARRLRLLNELRSKKVAGLTATAFRSSGNYRAPHEYGFRIVDTMALPDCIRAQWLSPLVGISVDTRVLLPSNVRSGSHLHQGNLRRALARHSGLFEGIADDLANRFVPMGIKIIGVVNRINEEACVVAQRLQQRGVQVGLAVNQAAAKRLSDRFVTVDAVERYKLPSDHPDSIQVLLSPRVISVGFDAPATECVAWLSPTLSALRYTQVTGRGARRCLGKRYCIVLDYVYMIEGFGYSQNFAQFFRQDDMVELERGVVLVGPDDLVSQIELPTSFLDDSRAVPIVDLRRRVYQPAEDWLTLNTIADLVGKSGPWVEERIAEHFPDAGEVRLGGTNKSVPYMHYPPTVVERLEVLAGRYQPAGDWLPVSQIAERAKKSPQWVGDRLEGKQREQRLDSGQNVWWHYPPGVYNPIIAEARALPKANGWLTAHQIAERIGKSDNWVTERVAKHFADAGEERMDTKGRPYVHYHPDVADTLTALAESEKPAGDWLSVSQILIRVRKVRSRGRGWVERRIENRFSDLGELRLDSSGKLQLHYPPAVGVAIVQETRALPPDAGDWLTAQQIADQIGELKIWVRRRLRTHYADQAEQRLDRGSNPRDHFPPSVAAGVAAEVAAIPYADGWMTEIAACRRVGRSPAWVKNRAPADLWEERRDDCDRVYRHCSPETVQRLIDMNDRGE